MANISNKHHFKRLRCLGIVAAVTAGMMPWPLPAVAQSPSLGPASSEAELLAPPPSVIEKDAELIDEIIDPEMVFRINPSRSRIVRTKVPVTRMAITDPSVLMVTEFTPKEFEFVGLQAGETTFSVWYLQPDGSEKLIRYVVRVVPESPPVKIIQERAEQEYGELQDRLNELFPNSQIQLIPVIDKLIVRGQARDAEEATQIMTVIRGHVVNQAGDLRFAFGGQVSSIPGAEDLPAANVVNLLQVPGEQQVMLKVRIAELTRSALRELGGEFNFDGSNVQVNFFSGGASNLSAIIDSADLSLFWRAFASNGYSKILAEPTLVTLSGRPATFHAGGEFAVPTAVGVGGIGAASTSFRGFGTQLAFVPTVLDKDRIRLQVTPSFSSLNAANSVDGIPGLNSRAVTTTVDLREGQWLAIAGLIQDEQQGSRGRLPYVGDIPIIGSVFGNQGVQRVETELVVLVSPELVHPLEAEQVPLILPGMEVTEPTDSDFFFHLRIEGREHLHHRSTVWPEYRHRIRDANWEAVHTAREQAKLNRMFNDHQGYYLNGPHGFSK